MRERRAVRGTPVVGIAAAGMVVGHWLAYLIAIPGAPLRARVLAQSGHGYWLTAVQVAFGLAAVGLGALALRQLRHQSGEGRAEHPHRFLAMQLVGLQISMFVVVEIVERLVVGEPVAQMFGHHVFLLGLIVQTAVAMVLAQIVEWIQRAVVRIAEWIDTPLPRPGRPLVLPLPVMPPPLDVAVLAGGAGLRGPPSH